MHKTKTKNKPLKEQIFKYLPVVACVLLLVEFDLQLWPGWFTLWFVVHGVVAAGVSKLLFPMLFDDYLSKQRKLLTKSDEAYNNFQIRKFGIVHTTFFIIWTTLNLIKFL